MTPSHDLDGFTVVLHWVRNVYPVEKTRLGWEWGFKFTDGFFETFAFKTKKEAMQKRTAFVEAISRYWTHKTQ